MKAGNRQHERAGFTLIEVLVVVAIIALLIAILLPSLAAARAQAKIAACKGNMHDLAISFTIYAETYKGYYPLAEDSTQDNFYSLWKARLLKNTGVLICPATRNVIRQKTLNYPIVNAGAEVPILQSGSDIADICKKAYLGRDDASGGHSYEYNGEYQGVSSSPYNGKKKRADQFKISGAQIMLVHENDDERKDLGLQVALGCVPSKSNNGNNCPQEWDNHGAAGMNMMFADSHVDFVKKLAGTYSEASEKNGVITLTPTKSVNAAIDQIMARSQDPWSFGRH